LRHVLLTRLCAIIRTAGAGSCVGERLSCCSRWHCRWSEGRHIIFSPGFIAIISRATITGPHRLDAAIVTGISRAVDEAAVLTPLGCSPVGVILASCAIGKFPLIAIHTAYVLHPPTSFVGTDRARNIVNHWGRARLRCHWRLCRFVCWLWRRLQCRLC